MVNEIFNFENRTSDGEDFRWLSSNFALYGLTYPCHTFASNLICVQADLYISKEATKILPVLKHLGTEQKCQSVSQNGRILKNLPNHSADSFALFLFCGNWKLEMYDKCRLSEIEVKLKLICPSPKWIWLRSCYILICGAMFEMLLYSSSENRKSQLQISPKRIDSAGCSSLLRVMFWAICQLGQTDAEKGSVPCDF